MEHNVSEKEQKEKLHDMWSRYFDHKSRNSTFDAEMYQMFWNHLGWLGNEGFIHVDSFQRIGFLKAALDYVKRYGSEVGREQTEEQIGPLVDFLSAHWGDRLEANLPEQDGVTPMETFAQDGEINGSLSTE